MKELTERQKKVLDWIAVYIVVHGFAPSVREIMRHFQWKSTNATQDYLNALERKGYITRASSRGSLKSRTIQLMQPFPVCGFCGRFDMKLYATTRAAICLGCAQDATIYLKNPRPETAAAGSG